MKAKLKAEWLKALRSGNYDQGTGRLCRIDPFGNATYCCLGVLVETAHGEDTWEHSEHGWVSYGHGDIYGLSTPDRRDFGLSSSQLTRLVGMNDTVGKSFKEIADYIEKEVV